MKRILVTGASGFIGRYLVDHYNNIDNMQIVAADIVNAAENVISNDNAEWIKGDFVRESEQIFDEIGVGFDIIFHCAGSASVGFSIENPTIDFERNAQLLQNVLWALNKRQFSGTFLFISTAGVYGNQSHNQLTESMVPNPISPYALNKRLCEEICAYFVRVKNMDIRIARVFSAYGSGLNKQLLWDMVQKWKNNNEIALFGTGQEGRDFIHIKDIIHAFECIVKQGKSQIYNVGNGSAIRIQEIANLFKQELNLTDNQVYFTGNAKEGDPDVLMADNHALCQLGYRQQISLEQGIKEYIQWAIKQ